jgi:3',5'-cyclic AMP phosphodiesterase CpdA
MDVPGNHEYGASSISPNYRGQFSLPGSWNYYSFNYSAVHFIVLDNGNSAVTGMGPGTPQYDWLLADLQAADADTAHPWKIVQFHKPPFCSIDSDAETRSAWAPLFYQYHVDLVFDGHKHLYERTYPVDSSGNVMDSNVSTYEWSSPLGTIYVTDGCGGAPFHTPGAPQPWSIMQVAELGFTLVTYHSDNNSMEIVHYNTAMSVIDSFWIVKGTGEPIPEFSLVPILPMIAVAFALARKSKVERKKIRGDD